MKITVELEFNELELEMLKNSPCGFDFKGEYISSDRTLDFLDEIKDKIIEAAEKAK